MVAIRSPRRMRCSGWADKYVTGSRHTSEFSSVSCRAMCNEATLSEIRLSRSACERPFQILSTCILVCFGLTWNLQRPPIGFLNLSWHLECTISVSAHIRPRGPAGEAGSCRAGHRVASGNNRPPLRFFSFRRSSNHRITHRIQLHRLRECRIL